VTDTLDASSTLEHLDRGAPDKRELAALIARDIPTASYVNLGIGQPTTVADHLDPAAGVVLHAENGMLGMGGAAVGDAMAPA
jgi:3-oxoadipate CoA-transferase beta subunit